MTSFSQARVLVEPCSFPCGAHIGRFIHSVMMKERWGFRNFFFSSCCEQVAARTLLLRIQLSQLGRQRPGTSDRQTHHGPLSIVLSVGLSLAQRRQRASGAAQFPEQSVNNWAKRRTTRRRGELFSAARISLKSFPQSLHLVEPPPIQRGARTSGFIHKMMMKKRWAFRDFFSSSSCEQVAAA